MVEQTSGSIKEWIIPFLFVLCAGWAIWHMPAYIFDFWPHAGENMTMQITELHQRKDATTNLPSLLGGFVDVVGWLALILILIIFTIGMRTLIHAPMEFEKISRIDHLAMFIGRITMMLIISITLVMLYEAFLRYAIETPTLRANELTLWIAGFVFMLSSIYAMQQRRHILCAIMPRWTQHVAIWFGALFCMNMKTSFLSPPFGPAAFYLKSVASAHISLTDIFCGFLLFIGVQLLAMAVLLIWPSIVTPLL